MEAKEQTEGKAKAEAQEKTGGKAKVETRKKTEVKAKADVKESIEGKVKVECKVDAKETRIALIGIIVENTGNIEQVNSLLHAHGEYIIGRMGVPYRAKRLSIISVVLDAPNNVISTLTGKLGMIEGISVKTVYSKA